MQNSSEILSKQKSDAPENISYPSQAQKTLCPCKAQADIWQPYPTSLWGVLAENFSYMLWFPSWKCDTLECQFSQVISPVSFLQWCILFDVIFKIPFFSSVCQTFPSSLSLFIKGTSSAQTNRTLMSFWRWIMLWFCSFKTNYSSLQPTNRNMNQGRWQRCWMRLTQQKHRSQWMKWGPGWGPDQYLYFTVCCWYWIFRCGVWPCEYTRNVWGAICVLCHMWKPMVFGLRKCTMT